MDLTKPHSVRTPLVYVHILAHGEAERWDRQLKLEIAYNDYGVLERAACLVQAYLSSDYVSQMIWTWQDIPLPPSLMLVTLAQPDRETLLHSIRFISAQNLTGKACTVWLLGDVAYSSWLMTRITSAVMKVSASSSDDIIFIGRFRPNPVSGKEASELFGVIVPVEAEADFRLLIAAALEQYRTRKSNVARLWSLYNLYYPEDGLSWASEPDPDNPGEYVHLSHTAPVIVSDDYSDDIDSAREYVQFYARMRDAANDDTEAARAIKRALHIRA